MNLQNQTASNNYELQSINLDYGGNFLKKNRLQSKPNQLTLQIA